MNTQTSYKPPHSISLARRFSVSLFLITVIATHAMVAQIGQNAVIKTTGAATTNSPSFFDATQFGGAALQKAANGGNADASNWNRSSWLHGPAGDGAICWS